MTQPAEHSEPGGSTTTTPAPRRARGRLPGILTRQVLVVAGALLIGCLIGWLLFRGHGSSKQSAATTPKITTSLHAATYPQLGLSLQQPRSWKATVQTGAVKLLSPDQTASIAITAPALGGHDEAFRRTDTQQLLRLFPPARVIARTRGRIGQQPALITEMIGRFRTRRPLQILSTALSSPYRTYSVQVFSTIKPAPLRLAEIRSTLASVRFSKPNG